MTTNFYVLAFVIAVACADACPLNRPIINDDFQVSCTKSNGGEVEIVCKTNSNWSNFPSEKLNLQIVKTTKFENCIFPADLSLYNITRSLGLGEIDTLKFEDVLSALSRENLKGFSVRTLEIENAAFDRLPKDLLYEINLERLFIGNTNIVDLPEEFFKNSKNLKRIQIFYSKLKKLKKNDFGSLEHLKILSLFGNKIDEIESGTFDKLINLRVLEISKNSLKTLPPMIFKNLENLETINLGQNDFSDLPADLLRNNSKLQNFRMSLNQGKLSTLPSGFFRNLTSLNNVELTSNGFVDLPADLFLGMNSLSVLNINYNKLQSLPSGLFEDLKSLKELSLLGNELVALPEGLFEGTNIEILYLDYNRLTSLSSDVLKGLSNLKELHASHNNLTHIAENFYEHAPNIEFVDLSYNELTLEKPDFPQQSVFINCAYMEAMYLSYNKISQIFLDWGYDGQLKNINLEGNNITYLGVRELDILKDKAEMNLRHNQITTIDLTELDEIIEDYQDTNSDFPEKYADIYLKDNPLNCDCQSKDFVRYLQGKLNPDVYSFVRLNGYDLRCSSPSKLSNQYVKDINLDELRCSSFIVTGDSLN